MRRAAFVACLFIGGCEPALDPLSWEFVTCAGKIQSDTDDAFDEAMVRLDAIGAEVKHAPGRPGINAQAVGHLDECEVTLFDGWDDPEVDRAAVPWHELVHCLLPPYGDHYEREIPALRQEMQVLRALGWTDDDLATRARNLLHWWGWLTDENVDLLIERCEDP